MPYVAHHRVPPTRLDRVICSLQAIRTDGGYTLRLQHTADRAAVKRAATKPWPRYCSCGRQAEASVAVAVHCPPHLHLPISIPFSSGRAVCCCGAARSAEVRRVACSRITYPLSSRFSVWRGRAVCAAAKTGMKTGAETHISLAIHGLHLKVCCGFGIIGAISN
jgi:hypothetical protein